MASSDDFKEQLKAGKIPEALTLALNGAVDLKITTWVTSAAKIQETPPTKPGHRLRTRINTLEGKVENEIGDQFIGNGPYRELRQFHLDQVTESNKIIHSNLKSLQKLFEVLIAMRAASSSATLSQSAMPLVLEPASSQEVESQLLQPAQEITQPQEADIEEFAIVPNSITEDVTQPLPLTEVPPTFLSIPAISPEALDEDEDEEEDDWDDSVLDLLESLPVGPDQPEGLDSPIDEDWRNFIQEEESPAPPQLDSPINQDWGILTREDFDPPQTAVEPSIEPLDAQSHEDLAELVADEPEVAPDELENQDWEKLSFEDFPSPAAATTPLLEPLTTEDDEDWGDLVEDEPLPQPNKQVPSLESLDLEDDDEWDDWVVESEPLQESAVTGLESLDLAEDDDWDDFEESDPFTTTPQKAESKSTEDSDADWDNFAPDELEPYGGLLDLDTNVRAGFDLSDAFEDFTPVESPVNAARADSEQNHQAVSQEHSDGSQLPEMTPPSDKAARDLMDVLFGDEPPKTHSNAATQDHQKAGMTEEELFADMQFEQFLADGDNFAETDSLSLEMQESEREVLSDDSEHGVKLEDDVERHPQSVDKIVPPPPPRPSHFPNQNN